MILIANTPLYGGKARVCACINTNDSESATKTVGADFMPNELWCQFLTFVLSGIKSCIIPLSSILQRELALLLLMASCLPLTDAHLGCEIVEGRLVGGWGGGGRRGWRGDGEGTPSAGKLHMTRSH